MADYIPPQAMEYKLGLGRVPEEPQEGVLWRGMSGGEYKNLLEQGFLESKGEYNIGDTQKGLTIFSEDPRTAEMYAHDFAPRDFKALPESSAYVVGIKKPEGAIQQNKSLFSPGRGEFGVRGQIPLENIIKVYRGNVFKPKSDRSGAVLDWQEIAASDFREPRTTDQSNLPDVISDPSKDPNKSPKSKGSLFRGIGKLAQSRIFPLIQMAQGAYGALSEEQKSEISNFLDKPAYELVGMEKPGLEYFKDLLLGEKPSTEVSETPAENLLKTRPVRSKDKLLGFSEQASPNTHEDLSLSELIAGYVISPAKIGSTRSDEVTREELVSRLRSDPELQKVSQKALKNLGYEGTIPLFRVILAPEGGFKSEGVVSTSLTPESHLDTIKYFTEGKISPFGNITPRLIRYDVPVEKVISYLPAFKDQIKRGVNKAVKAKGMGQQDLEGFSKVGDPARHAKKLLDKQKEVLVDVTGISPTFMKVFDAPESKKTFEEIDPRSIRMLRIEKIGRGQIKTPEDYRRDMGGNEIYFDPETMVKLLKDLGKDRFRQLENEHMQKEIEHYKKFFGRAAGGSVDKPLYEDARMVG